MRKTIYIIIGVLSFIVILIIATAPNSEKPIVKTIEVKKGKIEKHIRISGQIVPEQEVVIKSRISGILDEIFVKVGQKVKAGDALAKIKLIADPRTVEQAKAAVQNSEIIFESEKINFNRVKLLFQNNYIPKKEFEDAQTNFRLKQSELEATRSLLEILRKGYKSGNQEFSDIVKATASGTVLELPLKKGTSVIERNNFNDGSTIASIANLDKFHFYSAVSEQDILFLKTGMELTISVNALHKNLKAKLIEISPKAHLENGMATFKIIAEVIDSPEIKLSGFTAMADILVATDTTSIVLAERNLLFEKDSAFAEIASEKGIEKRYVSTGISDGVFISITKGLSPGEQVVVQ
ncbi:MAG: efflux RND transporter periplasmic adaptor subunit [Bacteroidales bacterium]|nr:efflux RND transporter periplasmic adaptor subunit [Bacteroidales bacterium]